MPVMRGCDTSHTLDALAESVVRDGAATAAAVGVAFADGRREVGGAHRAWFDLASVTKSVTALAIARSGLDPQREVNGAKLVHLLSHRAGFAPHLELFAPVRDGGTFDLDVALRQILAARAPGPVPPGGFPAVYSDLGYILAGRALAEHLGVVDAGAAVARLVECELRSARELGPGDYVPTELTRWRAPEPLCGVVHDENAWVLTGHGASGHAGLFANVEHLLAFGLEVLAAYDPAHWLFARRPGTTWRAGFDGKSPVGSSAGNFASPSTFGHLGFTGTSLWIDPERRLVTALLSNRVHPSRTNLAIKTTRPRVHDALFRYAAGAYRAAP